MAEPVNTGIAPAPPTGAGARALRLGLLLENGEQCPLLVPALEAIRNSGFADIVLVIERSRRSGGHAPPWGQRVLGRVYRHWDERFNHRKLQVQRATAETLLGDVPIVRLPRPNSPDAVDRARIDEFGLDVILTEASEGVTGLGACARCGVWSIGLGGPDGTALPGRAFYRQVRENSVARVCLLMESGSNRPLRLLGRSVVRQPATLSLVNALQAQGRTGAELLLWKLRQLRERGWESLEASAPPVNRAGEHATSDGSPVSAWLALLGVQARKRIENATRGSEKREWRVGLRRAAVALPWEGGWEDFNWAVAPPGHYLADPFLLEHDGRVWLFVEDYDYATERGSLICGEVNPEGAVAEWHPVLNLPFHLSFPLVFAHDGEIYVVPESRAGGRVDLYRCARFPSHWEHVSTLWNGPALDTVPFRADDGCWYFFTSVQSAAELSPQLLLFSASDLQSPWRLHPASPLSLDIRYARNGGRILERHDDAGRRRLYRVSQDGSGRYGSKLHFHEIEELTPERYSERRVGTRLPSEGQDGTHHYERLGEWEAVDAAVYVTRPRRR